MHSSILLLGAAAVLFDTASAHGFVKGVNIQGVYTNGSDPLWYYFPANSRPQTAGWDALNQDIGFVEPAAMGTADVNCHKSATAGRLYANANAGDTIQFMWNTWPVGHNGPIINYIAPCNGKSPPLSHHPILSKLTHPQQVTAPPSLPLPSAGPKSPKPHCSPKTTGSPTNSSRTNSSRRPCYPPNSHQGTTSSATKSSPCTAAKTTTARSCTRSA
jgi:hypothetical protein